MNGRYLSSNVNITVFNSDGGVVSVPVGSEYVLLFSLRVRVATHFAN